MKQHKNLYMVCSKKLMLVVHKFYYLPRALPRALPLALPQAYPLCKKLVKMRKFLFSQLV